MNRLPTVCQAEPVELSCVIVDDSVEFLEAAHSLLDRGGIRVVGVAVTAGEGLRRVRELRPQVVLVDIDLGEDSGFEVARRIEDTCPTPVILVSTHGEADLAELITASRAVGFISKSDLSARAIRAVLARRWDGGASATRGT
jgi:two-component system nitrate/nitrite response regulator NarL